MMGRIAREFQTRYKNSVLGAAWAIFNPLAMIFVYTVIFSQIMQARIPGVNGKLGYSIYLCAGLLTWSLFSEIVSRSQNVFIENAHLLKKIQFPKTCLLMVVIGSAILNFLIIFLIFTTFLILSGTFPGFAYFGIFPVLLILVVFASGLGLILGLLNIFFRDVGHAFAILLQFWFWLTPIVYPLNALPPVYQSILQLNPLTGIMSAFQNILTSNRWPEWNGLAVVSLLAVLLCVVGLNLLHRHAGDMMDEL